MNQLLININDFTRAYMECALWAELDQSDPETGGDPLECNYDIEDIASKTVATIIADCKRFQEENAEDLANANYNHKSCTDSEVAGHDFWLTRNGHGTGFWDRELGDIGDRLTDAAKAFGTVDLYVGDDGMIW